MGFLDGLVQSALGSLQGGQQDQLLKLVGSLLQNNGGIAGLAQQFNQAGLGQIISSWISTGQNAPVSASQLTQVLGNGQIGQIAQQLGVDSSQAGSLLAQYLPQIVDHLTPNGEVPAGHSTQADLMNAALGALKGKLFG